MPQFRVMCVQPIEVSVEQYEHLITRKAHTKRMYDMCDGNSFRVEWLRRFRQHHSKFVNFRSLYASDMGRVSAKLLVDDLSEQRFFVGGQIDISGYLQPEKTVYDLMFDPRFFNFVIVYELSFDVPYSELEALLRADCEQVKHDDLYNTIRRLIVKEDDDSVLSQWGQRVAEQALNVVEDLAQAERKGRELKVAKITNNTGNITVFVDADASNEIVKELFLTCNAGAERIIGNRTTVRDTADVVYAFHGRFHTIISNDNRHYLRFAPIQFHIQFVWFYVRYYSEIMDLLNNHVMALNSRARIDSKRHVIDEYINKIELLKMHNENFKLAIESDNDDVYSKIESKWNIESSLNNAQSYVSFFKDYLERAYIRKAERASQRQNHILFVISCIQILGLVSIWSDYLGLSKLQQFVAKTGMQQNSGTEIVLHINTWLPMALFVSLIALVVFAYIKRD
ncbi:hypothetical protein [Echinimonas agarilytica]|uniref:Uncharacterized protein n=1 Tax=Echinimonas agarilytica TaxID=1215918 RepID=A0AA42B7W1_9GAMM|nr:hypothetical protein [Echinimonas agarilytica]MCM2680154.1 hypothetical protein [Echinimonas agarilytica]